MAISVNAVYRTVLSIMNKEGRGYLTPDQFNKIGAQVQLDLLEKSFFDYNRAMNRKKSFVVNDEYGDLPRNIKEKIDILSKEATLSISNGSSTLPVDLYRIINITSGSRTINLQEVKKSELSYINASKLTKPSLDYPVYYLESSSSNTTNQETVSNVTINTNIKFLPTTLTSAQIDYVKIPQQPKWSFTRTTNNAYEFQPGNAYDFELHKSEQVNLVIKILAHAGVIVKDPTLIQMAGNEENKKIQLEITR
tara:strand:- start:744 stop:1496 length:753 start_codon:yes stop_codon:yes gene_type:complete